jgi:hypothetical protein
MQLSRAQKRGRVASLKAEEKAPLKPDVTIKISDRDLVGLAIGKVGSSPAQRQRIPPESFANGRQDECQTGAPLHPGTTLPDSLGARLRDVARHGPDRRRPRQFDDDAQEATPARSPDRGLSEAIRAQCAACRHRV